MSSSYKINEMFYSIQGEGIRAGTPAVFVRFAGCNLRCNIKEMGFDCDTDFEKYTEYTTLEIIRKVTVLGRDCEWVILTGGEPGMQVDEELIETFHTHKYRVAIETNGMYLLPAEIDWVTLSPKVETSKIKVSHVDEVKYVMAADAELPMDDYHAQHKLLSPAFKGDDPDPEAIAHCVELVKQNPSFRLSLQSHKFIGIR